MNEGGFAVVRRRRSKKEYPQKEFETVVRPFLDDNPRIHGLGQTLRRPEIIEAICERGYVPWKVRQAHHEVGPLLGLDCLFFDIGNRYGDVLVLKK